MTVTYRCKAKLLKAGATKAEEIEIEIANWRQPRELIGCSLIELVHLGEKTMMVDESGLLKALPFNRLASALCTAELGGDSVIVGHAIVLDTSDLDKCERLLEADAEASFDEA